MAGPVVVAVRSRGFLGAGGVRRRGVGDWVVVAVFVGTVVGSLAGDFGFGGEARGRVGGGDDNGGGEEKSADDGARNGSKVAGADGDVGSVGAGDGVEASSDGGAVATGGDVTVGAWNAAGSIQTTVSSASAGDGGAAPSPPGGLRAPAATKVDVRPVESRTTPTKAARCAPITAITYPREKDRRAAAREAGKKTGCAPMPRVVVTADFPPPSALA